MSYVDPGYAEHGYFGQPGSLAMFQLGSRVINFEQPPLRPPTDLSLLQVEFESAAGVGFALDPVTEEELLLLRWPRLFRYYRDQLIDFFCNVADGMAQTFSYRDPSGVTRTVRFAAPQLPEIREVAYRRYAVDVRLLVVS